LPTKDSVCSVDPSFTQHLNSHFPRQGERLSRTFWRASAVFCFPKLGRLLPYLQHVSGRLLSKTIEGGAMFGSKKGKQQRLAKVVGLLKQHPGGLSQSDIAKQLRVQRSTVHRDLTTLEQRGVLLAEDPRGRLSLFRRLLG
jgi:biotin operon repressor